MQRRSQLALLIATVLSTFMLAVAPVAADQGGSSGSGESDGGSTTTVTTDGGSGGSTEDTKPTGQDLPKDDTPMSDSIKAMIASIREKAKTTLQTERENHQEKTAKVRQQACEARQANINRRVNNYAAAAARHLGVFDSILTKVENFYTSKKLNVANYDTLLATAQAKEATAQQAVDVLKGLDVSIDCTQTDPAQSVATVKAAVADARTALQAYRAAIKDVIVALKGASTSQDKTTGGDQ